VADRAYLSIGEVLSLLKEEFPDITISKIRFLESQGLLDPERTPSGYRKFYEADVERLRWILQQQRENFLPLKVIKGRLGTDEPAEPGDPVPAGGGGAPAAAVAPSGQARATPAAAPRPEPAPPKPSAPPPQAQPSRSGPGPSRPAPAEPAPRPDPARRPPPPPPPPPRERRHAPPVPAPAASASSAAARPAPPPPRVPPPAAGRQSSSTNYTVDELGSACGLGADQLAELERFGLLAGRMVGGVRYYDEQALLIAQLAAGFLRFGVEARHLRMYKNAADREAGFFEQIVMPMMKQRNPEARRQAVDTLSQLGDLGEQLRAAMLREALREYTSGL
jgi:DNA-binding transcriptional MerR regulator